MTEGLIRHQHKAMGSPWEVVLPAETGDYGARAARACFAEVDRIEKQLSRFNERGDLARIASTPPSEWRPIAPETLECLLLSARLFDITGGAYDPTYLSRKDDAEGPTLSDIEVDETRCALRPRRAGLRLDFGALGKGYAIDVMVELLAEWEIDAALVQGGESSAYGLGRWKPDRCWSIGLRNEDDEAPSEDFLEIVEIENRALSGSGTSQQGRHIVDPRTGQPAARRNACWATAPSAALSDALSTAFMILEPTEIASVCAAEASFGGAILDNGRLRTFGCFP